MASFLDILIEMNNAIAKEQLDNIETSVEKVVKDTEEKDKVLKQIPSQVKGLRDFLEQQKKNGIDNQKELGKGVGSSISLNKSVSNPVAPAASNLLNPSAAQQSIKPTAIPKPVGSVPLKPPTTAKPTTSLADILKTRKI